MSEIPEACPFCGTQLEEREGEREGYWQHQRNGCYLQLAVVYPNGSTSGEFLHLQNWNRRRIYLPAETRERIRTAVTNGLDEQTAHRFLHDLVERAVG